MSEKVTNQPLLAADGTPLKSSLNRALRMQKLRALMLIAPLLIFVLITFIFPIYDMLFRSVENDIVANTLPRTVVQLQNWSEDSNEAPSEDVFAAFYTDLYLASEYKTHTRLGSRLNYQQTGISSLFRKTGRRVQRFDTDVYTDQFEELNPQWASPTFWASFMDNERAQKLLPETASSYEAWREFVISEEDDPNAETPEDFVYTSLYRDLMKLSERGASVRNTDIRNAMNAVPSFESVSLKEQFIDADKDWANPQYWATIKLYSGKYTSGYFLNAVDMEQTTDGAELKPENERIYGTLFARTIYMSLFIMGCTILLGYPVAFLLANISRRSANLLLILVLLPFWTSLLVRTSAWKVLLQQQGVINDILVWSGLIDEAGRLIMINNQLGTIIAMTHILLPFMILPLYSVMQTIPPNYVRAAKSLGANDWTAFRRVYFPQSIPGIGAGSILVFIMSIGYYITPEIVGGTQGVFISNRIAYHISSSLNWGLASALGAILLAVVLILYWLYDKFVGIDNMKLG